MLAALQGIKSSLASTSTTSGASSTTPLGSPPRRRSGSHSGVLSPSRTGAGIKDISPSRLRLANKQKAMESYAGRTRSTSLEDAVSPLKQSIRSQAIADRLSDLSRGRSVPVKLSANTLTPLHLERVSDRVVRISKPQPETNDDSRESEPTTEPNTGRSSVDGPGEANRSLFDEKEILGLKLMFSLFDRYVNVFYCLHISHHLIVLYIFLPDLVQTLLLMMI